MNATGWPRCDEIIANNVVRDRVCVANHQVEFVAAIMLTSESKT